MEHMMSGSIEQIAVLFADAWSGGRQFESAGVAGPTSAHDAYLIQDSVYAARYPLARATAWKAGTPGPQAEPTGAPIGDVRPSPAAFAADAFNMIGIEAEVAYRFRRDLSGAEAGAELADAIGEVLVTIEICDTRMADWKGAGPLWKLADFQLNGALVTGSGTNDWRGIDFLRQSAELWVDGAKKVGQTGVHPLGDPFKLLPWAVAHCAKRAGGLKAGDLVTTGSWTGMEFVKPGQTVVARFPGIGEASVRIG
jgi:2-keto-4-pentenoate hydratase